MTMWTKISGAAIAIAMLSACGDDGGGGSAAGVDALIDERETQIGTICDCFDELGFDTSSACRNAQDPVGPSMRDCAKDAFARDESSSTTYLGCVQPLEGNFSTCLDDRLECSAANSGTDPCFADYEVGAQDCIELPPSVRRDLENCGVTLDWSITVGPGTSAGDSGSAGCSDTCAFASDGECDDGGPNASFEDCDLGTDCTDCGPR